MHLFFCFFFVLYIYIYIYNMTIMLKEVQMIVRYMVCPLMLWRLIGREGQIHASINRKMNNK